MKKLFPLIILSFLIFFSCKEKEHKSLNIAVAANMQFAMKELTKKFTEQTGISCETIISSSGKLTAQIKEKADFDVFVAADMKFPTELYTSGFSTEKPKTYAYGKLVLWSMIDGLDPSLKLLEDKSVQHIAIANPKLAPYGEAAKEVLEKYKIYTTLENKLVYGESISQTNQFITSKAAELGFTAKSVVLSPEMKGKGKWIDIDEADYSPIAQGVIIIKHGETVNEDAKKFYDFLFSPEAKKILENYGYK